jgi:hypothetical protein
MDWTIWSEKPRLFLEIQPCCLCFFFLTGALRAESPDFSLRAPDA